MAEKMASASAEAARIAAAAPGAVSEVVSAATAVAVTAAGEAVRVAASASMAVAEAAANATAAAVAETMRLAAPVPVLAVAGTEAAAAAKLEASLVKAMRGYPAAPIAARRWLAASAWHAGKSMGRRG